jgi:hypothetical protein
MEFKLATSSSAHQKTISEIERTLKTVSGHKLQQDTRIIDVPLNFMSLFFSQRTLTSE